jgi:hypothetical protein
MSDMMNRMSRSILRAPVYDKSSALDLIFGFLQLGQRRGVFSFEESAKIFECMNQFADFFQKDEESLPEKEENDVEKEKEDEEVSEENDEKFDSEEEGPPAL